MNIQNITSLSDKLQSLGFEASIGGKISQHICFKPASFTIQQSVTNGNDTMKFYLFFEREGNAYSCLYYDAVLRKEIEIPVEGNTLDKRMAEIDWSLFDVKDAEKVELIVADLYTMESGNEGKDIACRLKIKHWADTAVESLTNNLSSMKTKFEISQRFYFLENGPGISLEEAYRFLNNRWLEKLMQKKKFEKAVDNISSPPTSKEKQTRKVANGKKKRRS